MTLTGVHLLLTYECNLECDHCFAWGSPWNRGTMTVETIRQVLGQARALQSVHSIYFEGGEPFLYYPVMVRGIDEAVQLGFKAGIVTNAYWATTAEDALLWLRPLVGKVSDLSLSSDLFHGDEKPSRQARNARAAAEKLGIPVGTIIVAECEKGPASTSGQLPAGESEVMYRGRAAEKLAHKAPKRPWTEFNECPHEDLREPGRVHIDSLGEVHICQGISLGNIFRGDLGKLCGAYAPDDHPIIGPLLEGGPAELVRCYRPEHQQTYADACHLCYTARVALRSRFPEMLGPPQMYGEFAPSTPE